MKKQLFLSTGLVLTSLIGFVGCNNTSLTSSEQQEKYKDEVKEVNQKTASKFEEEYKKDKFAFTFNESSSGALKGSVSTYQTVTDLKTLQTTTSTPATATLNESLSSDATAILSFDTAYYRSLNTSSPKATNDTYAYMESNTKVNYSDTVKTLLSQKDVNTKVQGSLIDGTATLYLNDNGEEYGATGSYATYDNYVAAGVKSIDEILTKETTEERIEALRTILKTYLSIENEDAVKYVDVVCDVLKSLAELETKDEITADDVMAIVESVVKQMSGQEMSEIAKADTKVIVEKVIASFKEAEIITISKETSNGTTNYKYSLNYANLITAVKATLESIKAYLIEQDPTLSQQISATFAQITTVIDTYLANIKLTQDLTFTVKDHLLTGVKEEFKVADVNISNIPVAQDNNESAYVVTYASLSISELSLTSTWSYEFDAKAKAELPTVKVVTVA